MMSAEYDFMAVDLSKARQPEYIPDNTQMQVEIVKVTVDKENCCVRVLLRPVGEGASIYMPFSITLWYPKPDDSEQEAGVAIGRLQAFFTNFGFNVPPTSEEQMKGRMAYVIVGQKVNEKNIDYPINNYIKGYPSNQ